MADPSPSAPSPSEAPAPWPVPWQPVWGDSDGPGSRIGTVALGALLWSVARLPEAAREGLLSVLAWLGTRLDRRRTRAAHEFLGQALGELPKAELERHTRLAWRQLLQVTLDTERLLTIPRERLGEHVRIRMSPEARRVVEGKGGYVIVSGHLGNWEAAFSALPRLGSRPVYGVAKPPRNKSLSKRLQASRESWGVRVLSRRGAMNDSPAILRSGGLIALIVDQRTSGRALLVPFFGRLARCERAPAVLLKRQRVPIVFASCLGVGSLLFELELREVLWPDEWARRPVEEIITRINQGLESLILSCPEQYVWIHDRYRDTPLTLEPSARARLPR